MLLANYTNNSPLRTKAHRSCWTLWAAGDLRG
jgi:hypothetical protein